MVHSIIMMRKEVFYMTCNGLNFYCLLCHIDGIYYVTLQTKNMAHSQKEAV